MGRDPSSAMVTTGTVETGGAEWATLAAMGATESTTGAPALEGKERNVKMLSRVARSSIREESYPQHSKSATGSRGG